MRSFELYLSSCKPTTTKTGYILDKLNKVLKCLLISSQIKKIFYLIFVHI